MKTENIFLFNYYFIGQFIFMSVFYKLLFDKKWVYYVMFAALVLLGIQYMLDFSVFYSYNSFGVTITQSIIAIYALLYYYKSLSGNASFLYVNAGVILYFVSSILFFASGNLILKLDIPSETMKYIGILNDLLYLIFVILIFVEWYRNFRPSKSQNNNPNSLM